MKIGLFFGSFNPIHIGHLIIANYMAENTDLDNVWLIVSPHNPLKKRETLADDNDRLNLVELATADNPNLCASDIEFELEKPSYTVHTLAYLKAQNPDDEFVLIMGGDNLATLHKWKNYEYILANYKIYVYRRPNYDLGELAAHSAVHLFEVPSMEISSTFIRSLIRQQKSIRYLVPDAVADEIERSQLYQADL
jgi:nicotinate-nucleotide adenylyltransferase